MVVLIAMGTSESGAVAGVSNTNHFDDVSPDIGAYNKTRLHPRKRAHR